jgi:hypothetical protein
MPSTPPGSRSTDHGVFWRKVEDDWLRWREAQDNFLPMSGELAE